MSQPQTRRMAILIPAVERKDVGWGDLALLLHSLQIYDPYEYPVFIAFKGNRSTLEMVISQYPSVKVIEEQPPEADNFGKACRFAFTLLPEDIEEVFLLNDDIVLTPYTIPYLLENLERLEERHPSNLGMVGCRTNGADGPQFIGSSLGWVDMQEMPHKPGMRIVMVAVWFSLSALNAVPDDWMNLHWGSDTLFTYDLHQAGYVNYTGTFYVHHHCSRASAQAVGMGGPEEKGRAAKTWIAAHRPDFLDFYTSTKKIRHMSPDKIGNPYDY